MSIHNHIPHSHLRGVTLAGEASLEATQEIRTILADTIPSIAPLNEKRGRTKKFAGAIGTAVEAQLCRNAPKRGPEVQDV